MTIANVALSDTFDTWRLRTNQVVGVSNELTEGLLQTTGRIVMANTGAAINVSSGYILVKSNTFSANAISLVSNSSTLVISGSGRLGTTAYFDIGTLSTSIADASTANIASAYTVNAVNQIAVSAFDRANSATVDIANTSPGGAIDGQLWWNNEYGKLFIYYADGTSSQWVDVNPVTSAQFYITNDNNTSGTYFPAFLTGTTGNTDTLLVSSLKLQYNPNSGVLSATEFNSLSDVSYKEDINPINNALDHITSMSGVGFKWKDTKKKSYGVVAQDLEKVIPDLVNNINKDAKTVNYDGIIAFLIEAIKELNQKLESKE